MYNFKHCIELSIVSSIKQHVLHFDSMLHIGIEHRGWNSLKGEGTVTIPPKVFLYIVL